MKQKTSALHDGEALVAVNVGRIAGRMVASFPHRPDSRLIISGGSLATNAEFGDDRFVTLKVGTLHVVKKLAAPAGHHDQTPAGVEIFPVIPQVFGQVLDPCGKQSDLHFARTGVLLVSLVVSDDFVFFDCFSHLDTVGSATFTPSTEEA
jgi:hypothetical protein